MLHSIKFNGKKITSLSSHKEKLVNFVEKLEWMTEEKSIQIKIGLDSNSTFATIIFPESFN